MPAVVVTLTAVLVPDLRPLSVGEIIDVAIKIWRRHLPTLARIVFVVVAPVQVLAALVTASVSSPDNVFNRVDAAGNPTVDTHALAGWLAGMFTAEALSALAFLIASAAVLRAVSVAYLGGTPDWRDSLRAATRRLRSLIWLGLLVIGGLTLAAIALFIPALWLGVSWSVAFPVLIAEGQPGTAALRRAFRLVRGRWWPTAGALALAFLFQTIVGLVLGIPLGLLTVHWGSDSLAAVILRAAVNVASSVITTPFMAAVLVLIYFDLRVRKEGFDLELLAQGVGIPGASLPPRAAWVPPVPWSGPGTAWPPPGGGWSGPGAPWPPTGAPWPPPNSGGWPPPSGGWPTPSEESPGSQPVHPPLPNAAPASSPSQPAPATPPPIAPGPPTGGWEDPIDPTGGSGPPPAPDQDGSDDTAPGEPAA